MMNVHDDSEAAFERGLQELAPYGPTLANGFTNHAPMVIEAMSVMGQGQRISAWIDGHRKQLRPWAEEKGSIDPGAWSLALGRPALASAWRSLFRRELETSPWAEVVRQWAPRLAPGAVAAALHGLIRVGHATRALSRRDTPARRAELAAALAAWASTYAELPARRGQALQDLTPREALARIDVVRPNARRNGGAITAALAVLEGRIAFEAAIDLPKVSGDLAAANRAFGELFADVFISNVRDALGAIVFTHGVTGFAAVDALLPLLSYESGAELIRRVWHASAGLYACYGLAPPISSQQRAIGAVGDLAEAAVAHGDDHVIKLTEACLRLVDAGAPERLLAAPHIAMELLPRP